MANPLLLQHGTRYTPQLSKLEEYTTPIELQPNESLYESTSLPGRGLFFIEQGVLVRSHALCCPRRFLRNLTLAVIKKIERASTLTANTRSLSSLQSISKLGSGPSTGNGNNRSQATATHPQQQQFRLARIGVGWVVGTIEAVSGMENSGIHLAVTFCRLHYLSYSRMEELEKKDPIITLRLYKLLSCIMAKRQELTTQQLGLLHAIMSSPAQNQTVSRRASLAFEQLK